MVRQSCLLLYVPVKELYGDPGASARCRLVPLFARTAGNLSSAAFATGVVPLGYQGPCALTCKPLHRWQVTRPRITHGASTANYGFARLGITSRACTTSRSAPSLP